MDARCEVVKRQEVQEVQENGPKHVVNLSNPTNSRLRSLGFAEELIGDVGRYGDAELLALIGFHH